MRLSIADDAAGAYRIVLEIMRTRVHLTPVDSEVVVHVGWVFSVVAHSECL